MTYASAPRVQQRTDEPADDAEIERVARALAMWHGSAMSHRAGGEMQTVASSFAGHRWAHATDEYADKKWQQYRGAAEYVLNAVKAEREACAQMVEDMRPADHAHCDCGNFEIDGIASAIRSRKF